MIKTAIINYPGAILSSVSGPYDILMKTNAFLIHFLKNTQTTSRFEVDILSSSKDLSPLKDSNGMPLIGSNSSIYNRKKYDLVIIPATDIDQVAVVMEREKELIAWIKRQHRAGAELASICLGAFILAGTGLLDGKKATTHWLGVSMFRDLFPKVDLVDDKIITDECGIYTSGGAFSFTTLMIYLVEKYCGSEAARLTRNIFLIHLHDSAQQSYSIFELQSNHADEQILKAQQVIEARYAEKISVEELAQVAALGLRTFMRRFKKATGNTPVEYIQRVRIEQAKKMLSSSASGVEQAGLEVGYDDASAFRKIFKRYTGLTPKEYRKRYAAPFQSDNVGVYNTA